MKHLIYLITAFFASYCYGAACSQEGEKASPEFITVVSDPTLQHQLAFARAGKSIYAVLVADPKLKEYFPTDTAKQLLRMCAQAKYNRCINPLVHSLDDFTANMSTETLTAGIAVPKLVALFTARSTPVRDIYAVELEVPNCEPKQFRLQRDDVFSAQVGVERTVWKSFYAQAHIRALLKQGKEEIVKELERKYLETETHDIAWRFRPDVLNEFFKAHPTEQVPCQDVIVVVDHKQPTTSIFPSAIGCVIN